MKFLKQAARRSVRLIGGYEPATLIILAIAAGGIFVFVQLAEQIIEGETHGFDERLLLLLRNPEEPKIPIGPYWVQHAMGDITALGGTTVLTLMTVMVTIYLALARRRELAIFTLLSVLGGWILSATLKIGIARPRPDLVPHLVEVHDLSFPSGHAMLSAIVYLTLGTLLARVQKSRATRLYMIGVAVFLTFIIGLSRIYLGVHYPTDVVGGWCAGASWALISFMIARRFIAPTPG